MRKILLWLGVILYVFGAVLILSNVVMHYLELNTSYDFGDQTVARFWHLGLGIAAIGAACLMLRRRITP